MADRRRSTPGSVSAATRRFEAEDAQMFAGAGRGPTPDEIAAAERADPVTDRTRDAYRGMVFRGVCQRGEGRI